LLEVFAVLRPETGAGDQLLDLPPDDAESETVELFVKVVVRH
jgi:hypothetical protein